MKNSKQMAAEVQGSPRSNCLESVDIAGVARMALRRCALVFELSFSDVICLLVGMTKISDGYSYSCRDVLLQTLDSMTGGICPRGCCL